MGLLVSHLHAQPPAVRGDRHALISQLARQVERLSQRLLQRELHRVHLDGLLNGCSHLRRRPEEAVRRHQPLNSLVRPAEVVAVDEQVHPPDAVVEVGEDGARQEFVPQRLPEALHLAERLRVVRLALDVPNAVALELGLEGGLSAPRRVLPAIVRQHLLGHAEGRDAALEGLEHQLRLLQMRDCMPDDEAAVVVHEYGDVEPLMAPQQEGEDVRLPELIGRRAFEARLRPRRLRDFRRPRLQQSFLVQDPPDGRLRHSEAFEAAQDVRDAARAHLGVLLLGRHHCSAPRVRDARRATLRARLRRRQRTFPSAVQRAHPLVHARRADAVDPSDLGLRRLVIDYLAQHPQPEFGRVDSHPLHLLLRHLSLLFRLPCQAAKGGQR